MTSIDKKRALREHLALISLEAYLILHTDDEEAHVERYNMIQQQIAAILILIDDCEAVDYSSIDNMVW